MSRAEEHTASGFRHLVFDLDDTLLDTYRQLVPRASKDACVTMIEAGLNADLAQCMDAYEKYRSSQSRTPLFNHLTEKFGTRGPDDASEVAAKGYRAFYNRDVESDISLQPGVREMLADLQTRYSLHLVTAGHRSTQEAKIRILKIENFFQTMSHVDPSRSEHKGTAFAEIMAQSGLSPECYLSIGNRVDTDISEARKLGWRACWVRYGEYVHVLPKDEFEKPDFVIDHILELVKVCRL